LSRWPVPTVENNPEQLSPANLFCTANGFLVDHLVGAAEQRDREGETERLGGSHVGAQFDFGGLLDSALG
jgi:hypothetical protein